jgi:hypothetical protein
VVVELGRSTQNLEARSQKVTAWLDARSDVESYVSVTCLTCGTVYSRTSAACRTMRLQATEVKAFGRRGCLIRPPRLDHSVRIEGMLVFALDRLPGLG